MPTCVPEAIVRRVSATGAPPGAGPSVRAVGLVMSLLVGAVFYMYTLDTTTWMQHDTADDERVYYWGPADAEFNWCEPDYRLIRTVAEPVNTATGLVFLITPLLAGWMHSSLPLSRSSRRSLGLTALVGVGTLLFHGTLRYWGQLLDELPIYYLILNNAHAQYYRWGGDAALLVYGWAAALTVALIGSHQDQKSLFHQTMRATLTATFGITLIYLFYAIPTALTEMQTRVAKLRGGADAVAAARRLFTAGFGFFALALVCWLSDNALCGVIGNLWLHSIWHCFAAVAIYLLVTAQEVLHQEKLPPRGKRMPAVRWMCGCCPYVVLQPLN